MNINKGIYCLSCLKGRENGVEAYFIELLFEKAKFYVNGDGANTTGALKDSRCVGLNWISKT